MATFITGKDLDDAVSEIIWDAKETLLIVSPFIKLDDYFKKLFDKHINNPSIHFIIVFGKNEQSVSKSMSKSDFEYFKKFLNVSVIYVPNLHAKYYGNESKGIITSINMYDYSFKNNIEFGILSEENFLNGLTTTADKDAWATCFKIAKENEAVFIKRPLYEKKMLSAFLGKNYIKSDILHDVTDKFYSHYSSYKKSTSIIKKLNDFPAFTELGSKASIRPSREEFEKTPVIIKKSVTENNHSGYCIRTGEKIPFNPRRPYCESAYKSWSFFNNPDFPEKYCHKSGKLSNGRTSMNRPVL